MPEGWKLIKSCFLPEEMHSLNKYTRGLGIHSRSARRHCRDTKSWTFLLRAQDGLGVVLPHRDERRLVRVFRIIHAKQRAWDDENCYGGTLKSINDALKGLGWIKDDNPKWRELEVRQIKHSDLPEPLLREYVKSKFSTVVEIYAKIPGVRQNEPAIDAG